MGKNWEKFVLLSWKNWKLQYRRPIQTFVEIIAPVIFCFLLVLIRSLVDPELHEELVFKPFCTLPIPTDDTSEIISYVCPNSEPDELTRFASKMTKFKGLRSLRDDSNDTDDEDIDFSSFNLLYSPRSEALRSAMDFFSIGPLFGEVIEFEDSAALLDYFVNNSTNTTFAAIQFDDSYLGLTNLNEIDNLKVSIRFPGETRINLDPYNIFNWRTNLIYPIFQVPGPRQYKISTGGAPSYYGEGFLAVQHILTMAVILGRNNLSYDNLPEVGTWLLSHTPPQIEMRRFPYSEWYEDMLLTALESMIGIIMMLSFVYTAINNVRAITTEKEKQLKEAMKIMGLPNWLHWTAWFVKSFIFLFISAIFIVVLLKVRWYSNTDFTVFTYADPLVMLLFLLFYICATITFCFAISVFFSKANTAATIAGMAWFLSYAPYLFMQQNYDSISLTSKLAASLGSNTAMAFGFQVMLMYEGTGEGIQWSSIFKPNTPDDQLTLGLLMVMLAVDSVLYLSVALYIEAVFPGEYGVAKRWYFLFTSEFWCGQPRYKGIENLNNEPEAANTGEYFEVEPRNLRAGIEIRNLRKITVLLGHNGAGKTTTMSMLTGLLTPNSGTAKVNGYDIRTNMGGVRQSLGLCPQHNIIFDELTVAEHLYFYSKLKGLSKGTVQSEIDKYVRLLELEPKRNAKSQTLSGGMKRKLCVGIALCGNSKIVMLDEPTAGMDPSARRALWDLLQTQKRRTMLLTTHFMDEADLLGDRIAIMAGGELQCCGSSFFLKKKYGAGYSLIMDKSKECNVSRVTALLRKYIPDIEVHGNVGSELTYLLVENQSSVFEPMLRELENHSKELGVQGYGISLTTLEEVFMKVGADHGQEEIYNESPVQNGSPPDVAKNNMDLNGDTKINIAVRAHYTGGWGLLGNQFVAMTIKKLISNLRSWILLSIQIAMPVLFLIIAIVVSRTNQDTGNLPAMPLTLNRFENPITVVQNISDSNNYANIYQNVLTDLNHHVQYVDNITGEMIELSRTTPNTVRRRYIAGASFDTGSILGVSVPSITTWFNNDPYHSPAIALGLVLNAMFRQMLNCSTCGIEFTNSPLPFTATTQVNRLLSGQNMGFQLAFNIAFSMAFVSSFYVLFTVRENVSKSKHLQFVSGVKVYVFWVTALLCDMVTYLITVIALLITLAAFQEDGFSTANEIGESVYNFGKQLRR
ncbi:hypothetical protein NQ317_016593 [Molorchus minor]|uniref:ABC transporter domain-containing protein n=1 Tax=Molorchus minor TaxID=1323400 RepID=A0ABQ9IU80_9CUCU|nr:hypothetical protein NQ317_016593 [Molorchus minor]